MRAILFSQHATIEIVVGTAAVILSLRNIYSCKETSCNVNISITAINAAFARVMNV